ncbi:sialate O-acetylesterase [Ancylomarina sp. 16SWW S1-10-2]|uniref:sialate O-acetylesterase n=1 Tax=Ancylomarina sp. 16SWW S1-10-2 TaxID=2499681 RepID=UPI0012AD3648|nr:sialate O-acetylesterase [Ancylomarina sp. 16SWW S1-10-2]MRT91973.1 hypothetical protein [Ancylomarina sp. 16SWW S1-10-2]
MKRISLILIVFQFLISPSFASTKTKCENVVHVVLLAGQSNMAGAGNFDELDEKVKQKIKEIGKRVHLSINGESPKPLSCIFSQYQKNKRGFGNVFGPEIFLGLTLAEQNPTQEYLFIKTSQGGTALYGAWNPEWTAEKAMAVEVKGFKRDLKLYSLHQSHIKKNLQRLTEEGKAYKIIGMCWMQGENDAAKEVSSRSYKENLIKLIKGYRSEFNVPEMPFVIGQINSSYGSFPAGPEMVRKAMVSVAESDVNASCIRTSMDKSWSDYPKNDDNVHYDAEGQTRLGRAFAKELMILCQ